MKIVYIIKPTITEMVPDHVKHVTDIEHVITRPKLKNNNAGYKTGKPAYAVPIYGPPPNQLHHLPQYIQGKESTWILIH